MYTMIVPGEGSCSLQVVSRGFVPGGMVLDEIDTCVRQESSITLSKDNLIP